MRNSTHVFNYIKLTNNTTHYSMTPRPRFWYDISPYDLPSRIVIGLLLTVVIILTLGGNFLVILSVVINKKLRSSPTNFLITSLAVADFLLGLLVLPLSAIEQIYDWPFGEVLCDIWRVADVFCCTASILSLCMISIDRYIGVKLPLKYKKIMTIKRIGLSIAIVWVLAMLISLGPLLGWKNEETDKLTCTVITQPGYVIFSACGSFYIPSIVIIHIYRKIYHETRAQVEFLRTGHRVIKGRRSSSASLLLRAVTRRNLSAQCRIRWSKKLGETKLELANSQPQCTELEGAQSNSEVNEREGIKGISLRPSTVLKGISPRPSTVLKGFGLKTRMAKFKLESKAAKTLSIVVGAFLICWLPFFLLLPIGALCTQCNITDTIFDVVVWLGYCNSMINPFIYSTWHKQFRITFVNILRCRCKDDKPTISHLAQLTAYGMTQTSLTSNSAYRTSDSRKTLLSTLNRS